MIRKIGTALAIAAGALAVTAIAAPANAANGDGIPNPGEVVLWQNASFTGPLWDYSNTKSAYPNDTTGLEKFGTGGTAVKINDNTSSIANYDATNYVRAYVNYNYDGAYVQLLPYGVVSGGLSYAYSSLSTTFNDNLSSHQVAGP